MGWLYEHQREWLNARDPRATLKKYALALGMSLVDFKRCLNDSHLKEVIEEQRDTLSGLYGVRGWPTVILRYGNSIRMYSGTDKYNILQGLNIVMTSIQEEQKKLSSKEK